MRVNTSETVEQVAEFANSIMRINSWDDAYAYATGIRVWNVVTVSPRRHIYNVHYLAVFDDLKHDSLRLGEDGHTLYVRKDSATRAHVVNQWMPIPSIEEGYGIRDRIVRNVAPYVMRECEALPRVIRGVRIANMTWQRHNNRIIECNDKSDYDDQTAYSMSCEPSRYLTADTELCEKAYRWAKTITVDTNSASNLMKMITAAALGTEKMRAYFLCGGDSFWQYPLLRAFQNQFPDNVMYADYLYYKNELSKPIGVNSYCLVHADKLVPRFQRSIDATAACHQLVIANINQLTSIRALQESRRGEYVFCHMREDLDRSLYRLWEDFVAEHGILPFLLMSCHLWKKHINAYRLADFSKPSAREIQFIRELRATGELNLERESTPLNLSRELATRLGVQRDKTSGRYVLVNKRALERQCTQAVKKGVRL